MLSLVASSARRRPLRCLAHRHAASAAEANYSIGIGGLLPPQQHGVRRRHHHILSASASYLVGDDRIRIPFLHKNTNTNTCRKVAAAAASGGPQRRYSLFEVRKPPSDIKSSLFKNKPSSKIANTASSRQQQQQQQETSHYSLPVIQQRVTELQQHLSKLAPLSLPLLDWSIYGDVEKREDLFVATTELLDTLEQSVQQGTINPAGKHGREVSAIAATLLQLYSVSCANPTNNNNSKSSAFGQCQRLLGLLDQWNLSRHEAHYHYALLAAVHEEQWEAASELFRQQINTDADDGAVFAPVQSVSVSSPVGLYAIARAAQRTKSVVIVEPVMNAVVNHLSLISPSDQDKCTYFMVLDGLCIIFVFIWLAVLSFAVLCFAFVLW